MKKIMGSSFEKFRTPEVKRMERRLFPLRPPSARWPC
jgi:hypothetical protein